MHESSCLLGYASELARNNQLQRPDMKIATTRTRSKQKTHAPKNKRTKPKQDFITCKEVERLYDGRWVIMDIRKMSRWNQPEAGTVVFSADSQKELFAYGRELNKKYPKRQYYFFHAGDPSIKLPPVVMGSTTNVPMAS
jgi:hypothetical protein